MRTRSGSRTRNLRTLNAAPLPVGLSGRESQRPGSNRLRAITSRVHHPSCCTGVGGSRLRACAVGRRPIRVSGCISVFRTRTLDVRVTPFLVSMLTRADDRVRTGDLHLGKVARYQLRYVRMGSACPERDSNPHCAPFEDAVSCRLDYQGDRYGDPLLLRTGGVPRSLVVLSDLPGRDAATPRPALQPAAGPYAFPLVHPFPWSLPGLNRRPRACQTRALPAELRPHRAGRPVRAAAGKKCFQDQPAMSWRRRVLFSCHFRCGVFKVPAGRGTSMPAKFCGGQSRGDRS
jgi:hypothetical protein